MPDLNKIIDQLSKLTVVEAAELSKQLEDKWGVTAVAPVAAAPVASEEVAAEEKSDPEPNEGVPKTEPLTDLNSLFN